jgi:hypothetical protein
MLRSLIQSILLKHRNLFFQEAQRITGFLELLMKQKNTGIKWTREERIELRRYLKRLSIYIPVFFIFALPFGSLLVPLLAEIYDRRKNPRPPG